MKHAIRILIVVAILAVSVFGVVVGVRAYQFYQMNLAVERDPLRQPGTEWKSENGEISFFVEEKFCAKGTIVVDNESVGICIIPVGSYSERGMTIFDIGVLEDNVIDESDKYEICSVSYKSKNEFVITIQRTTFFEEGQTITFHRIDSVPEE